MKNIEESIKKENKIKHGKRKNHIPNFDKDIFREITEIDVDENK